MNSRFFLVFSAALAAVWSPAFYASADVAVAAKHAESALAQLFGAQRSDAQTRAGMLSILDAVAAAATDAGLTDEWKAMIMGARRRISEGSLVDGESQLALHQCYRQINEGKPFRMPEGIRSVDDAAASARKLLESGPPLLRSGKSLEAVRALLETALMILTPIERG